MNVLAIILNIFSKLISKYTVTIWQMYIPCPTYYLVKYQYTEDKLKGYLFSAYCYVKK